MLAICMFDSIHSARWLTQFIDEDIDFYLIPSKKFRNVHPELFKLVSSTRNASFNFPFCPNNKCFLRLVGYFDFLIFEKLKILRKLNISRASYLSLANRRLRPNIVHAMEIQGAGYLVIESGIEISEPHKLIVTNWGSDIYFFQNFSEHNLKIQKILAKATHYSAECERDYLLARQYGFSGVFLPCIPNAGGFHVNSSENLSASASQRKILICKAYGGEFGLGALAFEAIEQILSCNFDIEVIAYSVTDDLIPVALKLTHLHKNFTFFSRRRPLSREHLLAYFMNSRVYLGLSRSDGISTSFLESLVSGAYPIQSGTSCANEWLSKGAVASIVPLNLEHIICELTRALQDDDLVDSAQLSNLKVAESHLSSTTIRSKALTFYL